MRCRAGHRIGVVGPVTQASLPDGDEIADQITQG